MKRTLLGLLLFLALVISGAGQSGSMTEVSTEAPASHVLDVDGALTNFPQTRRAMSEALLELEERHGFPAYAVIYGGLIGSDLNQRTNQFHKEWLGERSEGVVIGLDLEANRAFFAFSQKAYTGAFEESGMRPRLEFFEVNNCYREAALEVGTILKAQGEKKLASLEVEGSELLVKGIAARLDRRLEAKKGVGAEPEGVRLFGWLSLILLGLALVGFLGAKVMSDSDEKSRRTYLFPEVTVGERLGAHRGGGKVATVSFGSPSGGP